MVRHPDAAAGFSAPGARRSGSAVRTYSSFRLSPHAAVVAVHNQDREIVTVSQDITAAPEAVFDPPVGITNPPIDELLKTASSKYALVIFAAKRARQINDYYQQIDEGMLEYVGPLVTPGIAEKPLSIALREINAGLLEHTEG